MGKRITSLTEITTVTENDYIPVDNAATGVRKLSADFINDLEDEIDGKQDALTAGANISITQDGTISATDTTYTAGTNVDITNGVISATDTTYTAGTNITITNGEISATDTDTLSGLTDTTISSPSDGDALVYDSTSGKWVNGGVASDIGDLNDVDITTPSNGQVLSYNSTSQEWENTTPSAGSSVSVTQVQSTGTKIATVTVDGTGTDLYAPTPTEVVANPSGTGSTDLTKINIGGTIYDIPSGGGGGTTVVANPSGAATDELEKLQVGNSIYSIPSGGGSGYTETVLWDTGGSTSQWASPVVATLSNSLRNYDEIRIRGNTDGSAEGAFIVIPTSEIPSDYSAYYFENAGYHMLYANVNSDTQVSLYTSSGTTITYTKIVGVKYGGGSGGGSRFTMEELWSGNETASTSGTNITLTKNWADYDAISFKITNTSPYYSYPMILTKDIEVNQRTIQIGYNSFAAVITFLTDTTAKIEAATSGQSTIYKKIYGIKFGGGSSGGGNLYGTTDPTNDMGSNGDIYMKYTPEGVPVIDEDYTSSVWTGRIFVDSSTEAEITGFDMSGCYYLRVVISDTMDNTISDIPVNEIGVYGENEPYDLQTYRGCFLEKSADGTKLYLGQTGSNQSLISRIDVRRYTQAQTAITGVYGKVENKWVGFPNKGYSETVLWHDDNGLSFNGDNQQSIQLSDDMNNYDALAIEYACGTLVNFGHALCFALVSTIDKTGALAFWGNPDSSDIRSAPYSYYVDDTHIRLNMSTAQVTGVAYKVIGIKYGKGGGSGSSSLNYSTDEQVVGTWIDGKPLYQKTVEYTVVSQGASGEFDITSDFPITYNVRNCVCEFEYDYQGTHYSLTNSPTHYFQRSGNVSTIKFNMGSGTVSGDLTVTLRYTKNSD